MLKVIIFAGLSMTTIAQIKYPNLHVHCAALNFVTSLLWLLAY